MSPAISQPALQLSAEILSANEVFFDAMIRHQIGILKLSGHTRNKVLAVLDSTEPQIRSMINNATRLGIGSDSPAQAKRLKKLLKDVEAVRLNAWTNANRIFENDILNLAVAEAANVDAILKTSMVVQLDTVLPRPHVLRDIARSRPFEGKVLNEWANNIASADLNRIDAQIKIGAARGESVPNIARRVVGTVSKRGTNGVTEITRRQAAALVRTSTNAIGNFSRGEFYAQNKELFKKERFVATLDARTTDICASLDGKKYKLGDAPVPPIHFNCRSIIVVEFDRKIAGTRPARSFTEKQLLREFSAKEKIPLVPKRGDLPRGTKGKYDAFSRARKRELTGTVSSKVSYQKFLERQTHEFQNDRMGVTKARLFRAGAPLDRFVDPVTTNPFTLKDLAISDAKFFRAAGLNPDNFL